MCAMCACGLCVMCVCSVCVMRARVMWIDLCLSDVDRRVCDVCVM